jgi:hypothetical protein
MDAYQIINLASKHLGGKREASAFFCLMDANEIVDEIGNCNLAKALALKSLGYSVGMSHPEYRRAAQ